MINCIVCGESICKYELDTGYTVKVKQGYVCDDCAYEIGEQKLRR